MTETDAVKGSQKAEVAADKARLNQIPPTVTRYNSAHDLKTETSLKLYVFNVVLLILAGFAVSAWILYFTDFFPTFVKYRIHADTTRSW